MPEAAPLPGRARGSSAAGTWPKAVRNPGVPKRFGRLDGAAVALLHRKTGPGGFAAAGEPVYRGPRGLVPRPIFLASEERRSA